MSFSPEFIEKVKEANNIVDVVGRYFPLKQKGKSYWACCPFHHEKTASFSVSEDKQMYHCFGCKVGGTVIQFVQHMENCDFGHAIELLAKWTNIEIPTAGMTTHELEERKIRKKCLEILEVAQTHYAYNMQRTQNHPAHEYLTKRGLTPAIIQKWGIGLSPDWNEQIAFLKSRGYNEQEILLSGVGKKNEKGQIYDAMAKRIVFPIFDLYGNCIGFTGRVLPSDDNGQMAKYLNTAETLVFNKGKIVYGGNILNQYRQKHKLENLIVVEGNVDVISMVEFGGFPSTVACMGTALTPYHAEVFGRFNKEIYLCFDGDTAGRKATTRSIEIIEQFNKKQTDDMCPEKCLITRIIELPADIDPDNFIKVHGKHELQKLFANAPSATEYRINLLAKELKKDDPISIDKFIKGCKQVLLNPTNAEMEYYCKKIAKLTDLALLSVYKDLGFAKIKEAPKPKIVLEVKSAIEQAKEGLEEIEKGIHRGTKEELETYKKGYENTIRMVELDKQIQEAVKIGDSVRVQELQKEKRGLKNG